MRLYITVSIIHLIQCTVFWDNICNTFITRLINMCNFYQSLTWVLWEIGVLSTFWLSQCSKTYQWFSLPFYFRILDKIHKFLQTWNNPGFARSTHTALTHKDTFTSLSPTCAVTLPYLKRCNIPLPHVQAKSKSVAFPSNLAKYFHILQRDGQDSMAIEWCPFRMVSQWRNMIKRG